MRLCRFLYPNKVKKNALNPLWNETLNIVNVVIYGSREYLKSQPPSVLIEVIDHDTKV